jgi:hypothetical protein
MINEKKPEANNLVTLSLSRLFYTVQVISVLSIVFVSISIVGMTINTLPRLQYQVITTKPLLTLPWTS